jgi:parallel beta-helix repeat protein
MFSDSDYCDAFYNFIGHVNTNGVWGYFGDYNTFIGNTFSYNGYGVYLGSYNVVYHNNFIDNYIGNAFGQYYCVWNDSYPSGGNYWSDYTGFDNYSGPGQNITGSDGIGDTSYEVTSINFDYYPLMNPWSISNTPPIITDEFPTDGSTGVNRPPMELNVTVKDVDGDSMNVLIRWKNHLGVWETLETFSAVGNGVYNTMNFTSNYWTRGNTTYTWSINVTDGSVWINQTYTFTTGGSRYDVDNNGIVDFRDAGLCWAQRTSFPSQDDLIYDVDGNGIIDFRDAGLCWSNRD